MSDLLINMLKPAAGLALGTAAGCFLPQAIKKIVEYKCRKKGRQLPENMDDRKTKIVIIAADALLCAGACAVMKPLEAVMAMGLIQLAIICSLVDRYIRIIANETVIAILLVGIGYRLAAGGPESLLVSLGALGIVILIFGGCAAIMMFRKGMPGIGAGDLKYAMACAVAVGWPDILYFFGGMAAALLVYCAAIGMKNKKLDMNSSFPMCMQLSVGLVCGLIVPHIGALTPLTGV